MTSIREVGKLNIDLAETLDITVVQNFRAELKAALEKGSSVSLNGSGVEHIDTAALQVLAAAFRHDERHQPKLELRSPSEALAKSAVLLGIDGHIGLKADNKTN